VQNYLADDVADLAQVGFDGEPPGLELSYFFFQDQDFIEMGWGHANSP
jgi:hypothetical protein